MKVKLKTTSLFLLISFASGMLSSCSANDASFYMANYESYISNDLLSDLESGNSYSELKLNNTLSRIPITNFNYRTFATNEDLERNFVTNYDVAVPSMYLAAKFANEGDLSVIDWSKFGLYQLDANGNKTSNLITNAYQAMSLFSPQTLEVLNAYDLSDAFTNDGITGDNRQAGLLNYCVPYFLQDFVLGYKSSDVWSSNDNLDWNQAIIKLKDEVANKNVSKIAAVEDYRTLYSIAHLIQDERNNSSEITINPGTPSNPGYVAIGNKLTDYTGQIPYDSFLNTYKYLADGLSGNKYYLNSDSNNILNDFADPKGSQAIMSYNGDLLYATQGGDYYSYDPSDDSTAKNFINWFYTNSSSTNNSNFNIKFIKPQRTLILLDVMVINKKRTEEKQHLDEAYAVLKKIGLEGADDSLYSSGTKDSYNNGQNQNDLPIFTKENNQFIYGPMTNFDYIQYVSPLFTLNNYVLNSIVDNTSTSSSGDSNGDNISGNGYFTNRYSSIKSMFNTIDDFNNFISTLTSIYKINDEELNINDLIRNITDLQKSDMYYAFMSVKSQYF